MNKRLASKIILTIALAALLYRYIDWARLVQAVSRVNVMHYGISTVIFLASFGLLAWRLKALLASTEFSGLKLTRLLNIHMSSMFYGFVIPSDIGTAFARWYQLTRNRQGRTLIVLITVLERLLMLTGTSLFALVALYLSDVGAISEIRQIVLPVFALLFVMLVGAVAVMFNRSLYLFFGRLTEKLDNHLKNKKLKKMLEWYWRLSDFQEVKSAVRDACIIQLLYQFTLVARFVLLFYALDLTLPIADITWTSMAVILLTAVPITIAGLGVREGGFATILVYYSVAPELGVLIGLLAFSQLVCGVIWGGFSALLMKGEARRTVASSK